MFFFFFFFFFLGGGGDGGGGLTALCVCFFWGGGGLNGPLRQYFSLYRAVSQRVGEGEEMIDERKNVQTNPHPHLSQAQ